MVKCQFAQLIKGQNYSPYLYACQIRNNAICPYNSFRIEEMPKCANYIFVEGKK